MVIDKRGDMDFPFIHFKDPPEQPPSNGTYYGFSDNYKLGKGYNRNEIGSKEIKYIKRRHSRKC